MSYHLLYHPDIKKDDLPKIPGNMRQRIRRAIERRLLKDPVKFGEPLRRSLQGYRKLRVGDYRVIFKLEKQDIIILRIGHRREVYGRSKGSPR